MLTTSVVYESTPYKLDSAFVLKRKKILSIFRVLVLLKLF